MYIISQFLLDFKTFEQVREIFATSTRHDMDYLGFYEVDLSLYSIAQIKELFASISPEFTEVRFNPVSFGARTTDELIDIFKSLPATVKKITIYNSNFIVKAEEYAKFLNVITEGLEEFNFKDEILINCTDYEFRKIISSIHSTSLNLDSNNLAENSNLFVSNGFGKFAPQVKSLSLAGNNFDEVSIESMEKALKSITEITELDISYNNLFKKSVAEINLLFAAIAKNIKVLHVNNNNLCIMSAADIEKLRFPLHLKKIYFNDYDIEVLDFNKRAALGKALEKFPAQNIFIYKYGKPMHIVEVCHLLNRPATLLDTVSFFVNSDKRLKRQAEEEWFGSAENAKKMLKSR